MDFIILRKLAEGSCAKIFLVQLRHSSTDKDSTGDEIAVLKLSKPQYQQAAVDEAAELRRIKTKGSHPNIVSLLGYYEESPKKVGLLLEYCCGGSLGDYLRSGGHATAPRDDEDNDNNDFSGDDNAEWNAKTEVPVYDGCATIPVAVVQRFFSQLIDALVFLESIQLWHRDLKPDNILLTSREMTEASVKLSDFGFARRTPTSVMGGEKDEGGMTAGSPAYMSPERLRHLTGFIPYDDVRDGKAEPQTYDRSKADMWSTGLILYEMLRGCFLFGRISSIGELMVAQEAVQTTLQQDNWPHALANSPDAHMLRDLLRSMLEFNPSRRAGLQDVYKHPWLRRSQCHPLTSPASTGSEELGEWIPLSHTHLTPLQGRGTSNTSDATQQSATTENVASQEATPMPRARLLSLPTSSVATPRNPSCSWFHVCVREPSGMSTPAAAAVTPFATTTTTTSSSSWSTTTSATGIRTSTVNAHASYSAFVNANPSAAITTAEMEEKKCRKGGYQMKTGAIVPLIATAPPDEEENLETRGEKEKRKNESERGIGDGQQKGEEGEEGATRSSSTSPENQRIALKEWRPWYILQFLIDWINFLRRLMGLVQASS